MGIGPIIKRAVAEVSLAERRANKDQRGAGDLFSADLVADIGKRAANEHLVGPAHAVGDDNRAVSAIMRCQFPLDGEEIAD